MEDTSSSKFEFLASFLLPNGMLDWFDFVSAKEEVAEKKKDSIYKSTLHIYLDEKDNRSAETQHLRLNGFTEATIVKDFPVRDRNLILHIRRRRYLDEEGKSVILSVYQATADGTRYSEEFAAFLKGTDGLESCYRPIIRALFHD